MKKGIRYIWMAAGIVLVFDALYLFVTRNFHAGIAAAFLLGMIYLLMGIFQKKRIGLAKNGLVKCLLVLFILGNIILYGMILFLGVYGLNDTMTNREDAVIVLGAGIKGEKVTSTLAYRLDKAAEYLEKNPKAVAVVSGGQGHNETITEAVAMERYLIKKGVSKDRIIKEERSTSTFENFQYSKELLDEYFQKDYTTVFVTNTFHIFRAEQLSRLAGIKSSSLHCGIKPELMPVSYIRECMAVVKLVLFRR
ncbi:MAG: hypothetical protein BGN88_01090 [Clostridiales bacterium 43-6]|nr:MAG: hypothetical protein BGN88_01090 [Clostridiales bacterium 43-6]